MEQFTHFRKPLAFQAPKQASYSSNEVFKRRRPGKLPGLPFELGKDSVNLLTASEVSHFLRMPRPTVYFHTKGGRIPSIRIGGRIRYSLFDIEQILKRGITLNDEESPSSINPDPWETPLQDAVPGTPPDVKPQSAHALFVGMAGDDPAMRAWVQWAGGARLTPVIVPIAESHQFGSLEPCITFIDSAALQAVPLTSVVPTLKRLRGAEGQRSMLVFLHEEDLSGTFIQLVLSHGPAVFCPKAADADAFLQMERHAYSLCERAPMSGSVSPG